MTFIFFIIFYWTFSYLFLFSSIEFEETENTLYKRICGYCIIYILGGFLFPMVLGDILNDMIKHFNIRKL